MALEQRYRLLALDIDGTLVKEHTNVVSRRVLEVVSEAKKLVEISLISARAWYDQKIIVDLLKLSQNYHGLENGAKVINPQGEIEYSRFIDDNDLEKIVALTENYCHSVGYCVNGRWVQQQPGKAVPITTLSLIAERTVAEEIPPLLLEVGLTYSVTVGNHWSDPTLGVVLISHPQASKGGGLQYIQQTLGISQSETIAVGDGASDVPMLQLAGMKIAMGNAEEKLKKVATIMAPSVSEDGVAEIIQRFILNPHSHLNSLSE